MESRIIVDSCADTIQDDAQELERIPFIINIDDKEMLDSNLNINNLLDAMKKRTGKILTACPSPNEFLQSFQKNAVSFAVTVSSKLSGSYNSAVAAKNMLLDGGIKNKFIHVFDSKSACVGENLVALKIKQLLDMKTPVSRIVEETNQYISKMKTFFVIDSLDHLAKSGRISQLTAKIGSALRIVPIMGDNNDGEIELKARAYGKKGAIKKLVEIVGSHAVDYKNTVMGITHVNAEELALTIKEEIQKLYQFKDVLIFRAGGLSAVFADAGGIILAF